ncbi:MAG TPA: hypothetical protein VFH57_07640 [Gammaproteobacteria bacterium]|nr:hypothetical protein [Gammaproteobacteria bacterium]
MKLPVSTADQAANPRDDWRLAGHRAERYLTALGVDPAERRRMAAAAVARAAADPAWASKGATALTMIALQQALAERVDEPLAATRELMIDSAATRLRRWLATRQPDGPPPLETSANGHQRLASMPPMQRINMSPARITRRPAPLRWLSRVLGTS